LKAFKNRKEGEDKPFVGGIWQGFSQLVRTKHSTGSNQGMSERYERFSHSTVLRRKNLPRMAHL